MPDLYVIDRDGERVLVPRLHADRHLTGGADEIDGDKLDIDWNPSNYTPATTPAQADNVDNLAAHLYGIDQALASLVGASVASLSDEKAQNTAGGTFTSGAWRTRDLNSESDPDSIVSISSNEFTLGAGGYLIYWACPAFYCNLHQTRLYDVTGDAAVRGGSVAYSHASSLNLETHSMGVAVVSPGSSNTYRIEHRCTSTRAGDGFGFPGNITTEVYTVVSIIKVS